MKITRRQLRKLIAEAIDESRRYIDNPDGGLTRADRAYQSAVQKDMHAAALHPKLSTLVQSTNVANRVQGRDLAHTIADEDSALAQAGRLTPEEETAIDQMGRQSALEADRGLEQVIDKEALYGAMKSRSKAALRYFGFQHIEDIPHLSAETGEAGYEDVHDMLRFQAQTLGCDVYDLAFVSTEDSNKTYMAVVAINDSINNSHRTIPGDTGEFGYHELYDLGGFKALFSSHHGGYYTVTICGK